MSWFKRGICILLVAAMVLCSISFAETTDDELYQDTQQVTEEPAAEEPTEEEPAAEEPAAEEPVEEEPAAEEPAEEEPVAEEPTEDEPAAEEPAEEEPAAEEPTEEESTVEEPTEEEPAAEEPATEEPVEEEPAAEEPTEEEPAAEEPTEEEPAAEEPTEEEPAAEEPTEEEPAAEEPTEEEPTEEEPAAEEPTEEEPAAEEPAEEEPAAEEPTEEEPATEEPVEEEPATEEPTEEDPATEEPTEEEVSDFVIDGNVLVSYTGDDANVVVPADVTVIGASAFAGNEKLVSVTFGGAVEEIKSNAFKGCINLETVRFADVEALEKIGGNAFADCVKLSYGWADSVKDVAESAFAGCVVEEEVFEGEDEVVEEEPAVEEPVEGEPSVEEEIVLPEDDLLIADDDKTDAATPVITKQPEDYTGLSGNAVFTVEAEGEGLTYQWQFRTSSSVTTWKDSPATGNQTTTVKIEILERKDGYQYRCAVTDANGSVVYSDIATLIYGEPSTEEPEVPVEPEEPEAPETTELAIVTQPSDYTGKTGNAKFTVVAEGEGLTYQWQFRTSASVTTWKDSPATGCQTPTVSIEILERKDGYQYRCVITDASGNSVTSAVATLIYGEAEVEEPDEPVVPEEPEETIVITAQPSDYTGKSGDAVFTVAAEGVDLTYQWQFRTGSTVTTWKDSPATGHDTPTVYIEILARKSGYQYRCVITDAAGNSVISDIATLIYDETVEPEEPEVPAVSITKQPEDFYGTTGNAVFTVEAEGEGLTYLWQFRNSASVTTWKNSPATGYDTATVSVQILARKDGYQYRCIVTDANGNTVTSEPATLCYGEPTVDPDEPVGTELKITSQPVDYTGKSGNAVYTVKAEGDDLTYQWQFRTSATAKAWQNSPATGNDTDTVSIQILARKDGYQYRCVITDAYGNTVTSDVATLIYGDVEPEIVITKQPEDFIGKSGNAIFTVEAEGDGLTYQWQFRTSASATTWKDSPAAGYDTASVAIEILARKNGYQYRCVITGANGGTLTSDPATLIYGTVLAITTQPADVEALVYGEATFTVEAAGDDLTYQWEVLAADATEWAACTEETATAASLVLAADLALDGSQYHCIVTDGRGNTETTDTVTLTVTDTFTEGGVTYRVTAADTVEVAGYTGAGSSVTIPAQARTFNVTRVGDAAFEGNTTITTVDLPDTILTIGKRAFANCTSLAEVK